MIILQFAVLGACTAAGAAAGYAVGVLTTYHVTRHLVKRMGVITPPRSR